VVGQWDVESSIIVEEVFVGEVVEVRYGVLVGADIVC
jgi:hypothetical protein